MNFLGDSTVFCFHEVTLGGLLDGSRSLEKSSHDWKFKILAPPRVSRRPGNGLNGLSCLRDEAAIKKSQKYEAQRASKIVNTFIYLEDATSRLHGDGSSCTPYPPRPGDLTTFRLAFELCLGAGSNPVELSP